MAKTAIEKLEQKKEKKEVLLEKDFAGIKAGQLMLVATPQMVDEYIKNLPRGKNKTMVELRDELATQNQCDKTCPVSTAIFVRIVAEAALERLDDGADVSEITPFWRVVAPEDKIASKLQIDSDWIRHQRHLEL